MTAGTIQTSEHSYRRDMPYDVVDAHLQVWDPETVHYPWMSQDPSLLHRTYRVGDVGGAR